MTQEQHLQVIDWQRETFPSGTVYSCIKHLTSELRELLDAETFEQQRMEFADCFLLLFGAADRAGMSYDDVCKAIEDKMEINRNRTWGKPNADGYVEHIKEIPNDPK